MAGCAIPGPALAYCEPPVLWLRPAEPRPPMAAPARAALTGDVVAPGRSPARRDRTG